MNPGHERKLVTAALVLGMFLAAIEATAVGTAMPTAIGELGGVRRYSWVFSAYLLTSTTTVPLYGKLADLYGRRRIYFIAVALFLLGSALSGAARSMSELILFRALQGLGAGGVLPITITLIGDIYSLEERGQMQGIFSGVWGVSSLVGPALGGLLTDTLSWRWVFYINVPFGLASAVLLRLYLTEMIERQRRRLDFLGTISLTTAVTLLLVTLLEGANAWGWLSGPTIAMLAGSAAGVVFFLWHERRVPDPMLPLDLFRNPVIAIASLGSVVIGILVFSTTAYVPMYAQGVLGGTALDAGITLAPMSIGWPIASTLSGRLLLRFGYRPLAILGGGFALAGGTMLATVGADATRANLMAAMLVTGLGLGSMSTPYLVAVQNAVPWQRRGVATSSVQFFRTIGGSIAVAVLGVLLTAQLAGVQGDPSNVNVVLDPTLRSTVPPAELSALAAALGGGLRRVYVTFALVGAAGLIVAMFFPAGPASDHAHADAGGPGP